MRAIRWTMAVVLLAGIGCTAASPGPAADDPAVVCQMASDHVGTCVDAYCADNPTDILCGAAGAAAPLAECTTAAQAEEVGGYLGATCSDVIVSLHAAGGPADNNCPYGLQWLCDLLGIGGGSSDSCCVNCQNDPEDVATCRGCFDAYDGDGDGRIITLYCVGTAYCNGCTDADCNGVCDADEPSD